MLLSRKHANQTTIARADFSGGLNTTGAIEGIAENQLADVVNMEVDHSTGRLKTVGGTTDILTDDEGNITAAFYDQINNILLVVKGKDVYPCTLAGEMGAKVGEINGELYPKVASWEDGLLIASGDKLQYFDGVTLKTIDSPQANGVYVRAGRVLVTDDTSIHYSGIGDEENWDEESGDDSTAKFVEVGYKDGGKFIGMASLSQDVLLIKDNRRVYRLSGEYPDWVISEVSRNVECSGRMSYCSIADATIILGLNEVQAIQTTDQYGAMKPSNVATLITSEIQNLPPNAKVRYVPPLSQVWAIGNDGQVLMLDVAGNAWFRRVFNSPVIDVFSVGDMTYVVKSDRISYIDELKFYDNGEPLKWSFTAQRLVSQHDFLLKRTQISVIPFSVELYTGRITVGAVIVPLPFYKRSVKIYKNKTKIYKCKVKIQDAARNIGIYMGGTPIYESPIPIYKNPMKLFERRTIIKESRNVYRGKFIDISGYGTMGGFMLNGIILDVAEV